MQKVQCPYCGSHAELKDAIVIYRKLGFGQVYICGNYPACDSYVGVHEGTDKPKGSLANKTLRDLRKQAHAIIDPMWKEENLQRKLVYQAAAQALKVREFHIGDMREEDAKAFIANSINIVSEVKSILTSRHSANVSQGVNANLVGVLKYLFIHSQRTPTKILSHRAYKGHMETFKAGIEANLVRRIQAKETRKVYFALTSIGEKLINA